MCVKNQKKSSITFLVRAKFLIRPRRRQWRRNNPKHYNIHMLDKCKDEVIYIYFNSLANIITIYIKVLLYLFFLNDVQYFTSTRGLDHIWQICKIADHLHINMPIKK